MRHEKDTSKQPDQSEILEVIPVDSPSENFFVIQHLQRVPTIISRGLVYLIVLVLLTAFIYSVASKIDIVVTGNAVARPASHKIKILSDRNGFLERIFIQEGQTINKNAPLFLIRSKEGLTYRSKIDELTVLIPIKQEHFDTKISAALARLEQLQMNFSNSIRIRKLKLAQIGQELKSIDSDIEYWKKECEFCASDIERFSRLLQSGSVAERELAYAKIKYQKAQSELTKLMSKKGITEEEKNIIEKEIEKERTNYNNEKTILEKEIKNIELEMQTTLNALQKELEVSKKMVSLPAGNVLQSANGSEEEKVIIAESAGIISELYFKNTGQYIRESDLLCTIIPTNTKLYFDITVANKNVGFIEEHMQIKYKIDAFPYKDYGVLSGKVTAISPSAVYDEKLGFVYHVHGSFERPYLEINGKTYPIKPGMTATAELVTEKKSIFALLVKKFRRDM